MNSTYKRSNITLPNSTLSQISTASSIHPLCLHSQNKKKGRKYQIIHNSMPKCVYKIYNTYKIYNMHIRGLSEKYREYLYTSALALFFIIRRVASFKVIPTWFNNTVPAIFPLLETVMELTFMDGLKYDRLIIFNHRFVIESLSFEWFFEFWKQPKVTGGYVGTIRRLSKQCDAMSHPLNIIQCFCRRRSARTRITINRSTASFETIIPLFYSCFVHTLIPKGVLHHLNSFRTRFPDLKRKFDANSLILFFSHF